MNLKIGIVGLPNVGKSTLFNALTKSETAQAANYPFCTIDPNIGIVEVPDKRINKLSEMVNPAKIIPAIVEFVDIAGLVKGASKGEGLGNQFLHNIRECHAIAQVVRFFKDDDITHVHNSIDPKRDIEIIQIELILADLDTVNKKIEDSERQSKSGDKEAISKNKIFKKVKESLENEILAINIDLSEEEREVLKDLHLLSNKPFIYIANLKENEIKDFNTEKTRKDLGLDDKSQILAISAKMENDLMSFSEEERNDYLNDLGLKESGLHALINSAYKILGLETYFTAGPKEVRAWTIKKGSSAPKAAGVIHTDFEKGFIKAETISYTDYIKYNGEQGAKENGKMRMEGKTYIVQDGDIMHFKFSN